MKRIATAAVLVSVMLTACQWQQQKHSTAPAEQEENVVPPLYLGTVHQVYPEQGFVLLRIIGPLPGPGTVLITHPADGSNTRIGNLMVTSDQPTRNRIIAAEVRSGNLMKGDRVFLYRNIAQPEEKPETEETAEPEAPTVIPNAPESVMPTDSPVETPTFEEEEPVVEEVEEKPKKKNNQPQETPQHILDIPDNIEDWD